jgi:hypothetical protein
MPFQVIGTIIENTSKINWKTKPYKSKIFYTEETALKHMYSMIYQKNGNIKRVKNVLVNSYIKPLKFKEI